MFIFRISSGDHLLVCGQCTSHSIHSVTIHTYLLTYLLTPCSRVLLEKLTDFAANQEIPRILWNPKVHYHTQKRPPPVSILSQIHPVYTTPSHFLKIHLNITLPSTPRTSYWFLSVGSAHQKPTCTSPVRQMCCMSAYVVLDLITRTICGEKYG